MNITFNKKVPLEFIASYVIAVGASTLFIYALGDVSFNKAINSSFQFLAAPIEALSWFGPSRIIMPVIIVITAMVFIIKSSLLRAVSLQIAAITWLFFGFVCAATRY